MVLCLDSFLYFLFISLRFLVCIYHMSNIHQTVFTAVVSWRSLKFKHILKSLLYSSSSCLFLSVNVFFFPIYSHSYFGSFIPKEIPLTFLVILILWWWTPLEWEGKRRSINIKSGRRLLSQRERSSQKPGEPTKAEIRRLSDKFFKHHGHCLKCNRLLEFSSFDLLLAVHNISTLLFGSPPNRFHHIWSGNELQ